jgi:chromate transport protein ChrA
MTNEISMFGLKHKASGGVLGIAAVLVFVLAAFLLIFLLAALVLYSFHELTGLLTFSWLNSIYTAILLIVAKYTFSDAK